MLKIVMPANEYYDEGKKEFLNCKEHSLQLEHSLISLSKWESKWCKTFLTKEPKNFEESVDYIRCMTLTQNVDQTVYFGIKQTHIDQVGAYIEAPMSATTISKINDGNGSVMNKEIITAELIYYWMISLSIPFECQKWHLNRLLTLINVCNIKNQPPKKMNKGDIMRRNASLNAARRQTLNSKG